jgi:hypothetical protein
MASKRNGNVNEPLRITFGTNGKNSEPISWSKANPSYVVRLIDLCNLCGCAPSFAITSDGGAYRVYFLHESIPTKERSQYLPGSQDVDEWLGQLIDFWEGVLDVQKLS